MTRRRTILLVLPVALVVVAVLALVVVRALPDSDEARAAAQAAADRVAPGSLRVIDAQWRGEAGGYRIDAVLLTGPPRSVGWTSDRRCEPGSTCEQSLLTLLASAGDGGAERAALVRAFTRCGRPPTAAPTMTFEPPYPADQPRTVAASLTVVEPLADPATDLEPPGATLDACVAGWGAERSGLTPMARYRATVTLTDLDGRPHSATDVTVTGGRVTGPAAAGARPVLDRTEQAALAAALDGPVLAFLAAQGPGPSRITDVRTAYAPGSGSRLVVQVDARRLGTTGSGPGELPQVVLTSNRDGSDPSELHLVR